MAPSSDFSHAEAVENRRRRGPPFALLVPLIYAPILPLIRLGLRHKPVLRDRLFFGVLAGAFAHGTYLVSLSYLAVLPTCLSFLLNFAVKKPVKLYASA